MYVIWYGSREMCQKTRERPYLDNTCSIRVKCARKDLWEGFDLESDRNNTGQDEGDSGLV